MTVDKRARVLFVCHGNICRSPMAEFVLKDMVERRGLADRFHIESAATTTDEIGNPVHPGTRRILAREGISCEGKTARQIAKADYDAFDVIIGMDDANMRSMERRFGGDPAGKLHKMMEFAGTDRDVADPWYTGDFETTYDDVRAGCTGLMGWLGF
jgi:Protein-tyrosine-phosphatase